MMSSGLSEIFMRDGIRRVERSDVVLSCGKCSTNEKGMFTIERFYVSGDQCETMD